MEVIRYDNLAKTGSLLESLIWPSDTESPLTLGLYWSCVTLICYTILVSFWRFIDILGAKFLRKWRKTPATLPLSLPVLGHALYFASNMPLFSYGLKKMFPDIPIKIHLSIMDNIVFTRPEDIVHIFEKSAILTGKPVRKLVSNTFDVPEESRVLFAADETGLRHKAPQGQGPPVKQEYRVDYLMHTFITQFLSGPSLGPLANRFTENLIRSLEAEDIGDEWKDFPDLWDFIREHMFHASITAMFGEQLFKIAPQFGEDFWKFEDRVPELAKGLPKWLNRSGIDARDRCLASVQSWGAYLKEQSNVTPRCDPVYDPVFGSDIVQKRHDAFAKIASMSPKAIACEDLGLIWASTANAIRGTFWLIYETLRHSEVPPRFRSAIKSATIMESHPPKLIAYSISALCGVPLLQSLYTETLRLYVSNYILRSPMQDLDVRRWRVKRGEIIAMMSYAMHRDSVVYNTGSDESPRPLHEFWADRFLVPCKNRDKTDLASPESSTSEISASPNGALQDFSMKGLDGAWMPFGGGSNMCPGRHLAKQEMLLETALLLGNFEVELTGPPVRPDYRFFGSGVVGAIGKTKFRIRRRRI